MKSNIYKKIDKETASWDLNAGCRRFIINNERNRKLRRKLRKTARKTIGRWIKQYGEN